MRDLINLVEGAYDTVWYHGSDRDFTAFDSSEIGSRMGRGSPGFWFTTNPELTGFYGHIQYSAHLHINEPKIITQAEWQALSQKSPSLQAVLAARDEYDALIIEDITDGDVESTVCCVFEASAISIISREINEDHDPGFTVSVNDLLLHRQSVVITMKDLIRGKFSHTTGSISVTSADGRFVVGDGCHRLLQALLVGKRKFRAKIDSRYATEFGIAPDKLWTPDVSSPTLGLEALGFSAEDIITVRKALAAKPPISRGVL